MRLAHRVLPAACLVLVIVTGGAGQLFAQAGKATPGDRVATAEHCPES